VDVLKVFEWYFQAYEDLFQRSHPNIRSEQIQRIIEAMPACELTGIDHIGIDPMEYKTLISQHFGTEYNRGKGGCDYNINHFFSGNIRALRYYETIYMSDIEGGVKMVRNPKVAKNFPMHRLIGRRTRGEVCGFTGSS